MNKIKYYLKWFLRRFLGIQSPKMFLYRFFGIRFPKLKSQQKHWTNRGAGYMEEFFGSTIESREIFFQNLLIQQLATLEFDSVFEAGSGFGWNIKRLKKEYPGARVGGLDFSMGQLINAKDYLNGYQASICCGDNCKMPFKDDAYDIGISIGVFMNIHSSLIRLATSEMARVCKKYIIHFEYDEKNTTEKVNELFRPQYNIISHDYRSLYKALGTEVLQFQTYKDFDKAYEEHVRNIQLKPEYREYHQFPAKYTLIVIKV